MLKYKNREYFRGSYLNTVAIYTLGPAAHRRQFTGRAFILTDGASTERLILEGGIQTLMKIYVKSTTDKHACQFSLQRGSRFRK